MALNKQIYQKVLAKTDKDRVMRNFLVEILREENTGRGWYKDFYRAEIEKAIQEVEDNEN